MKSDQVFTLIYDRNCGEDISRNLRIPKIDEEYHKFYLR